jgi:hypothetical protein
MSSSDDVLASSQLGDKGSQETFVSDTEGLPPTQFEEPLGGDSTGAQSQASARESDSMTVVEPTATPPPSQTQPPSDQEEPPGISKGTSFAGIVLLVLFTLFSCGGGFSRSSPPSSGKPLDAFFDSAADIIQAIVFGVGCVVVLLVALGVTAFKGRKRP